MKAKIKYIILAFSLLIQFSCSDWMGIIPTNGLVREEFYKQKEDVQSVLMAAYEKLSSMDEKLFLYGELRADLLEAGSNQSDDEQNVMNSNIFPNNNFCHWKDFYEVINYCNEVIKNAPLVKNIDETFTSFEMESMVSEAYFLRSLTYFYLVRIYKDAPLILEPSEDDNVNFFVPKSSEEDILNQIVDDLNNNRESAPSGSFTTIEDNKGRASKASFDALLADIELWRFNYDEVIKHADKIIYPKGEQKGETNDLVLLPGTRWFELFYPGNSLESIFELQYDQNLNQRNHLYSLTNINNNRYFASQKAIQMFAFEYSSEIVRGEKASIADIGSDAFMIWKYAGQAPDGKTFRSGTDNASANFIIYRYADVLLMKAEALAMLDRFSESQQLINLIRDRASVSTLSLANSKVAFEDAIMKERSLEFAYEGKRWFDLLRLGRRNNYARKSALISVVLETVPSTQKRILATRLTDPMGWYLPISDDEIERNKELVQNPYYAY